jgi:hypothetical protein
MAAQEEFSLSQEDFTAKAVTKQLFGKAWKKPVSDRRANSY